MTRQFAADKKTTPRWQVQVLAISDNESTTTRFTDWPQPFTTAAFVFSPFPSSLYQSYLYKKPTECWVTWYAIPCPKLQFFSKQSI